MDQKISGFKKEGQRAAKIVVLLEGEPWATLDPETVIRERLKNGQALDAARREAILATDEAIRARKAAAGHAAHTPKTRLELEHFLRSKRYSELAITAALATLSDSGTVDDERVAGWLVQNRRRKNLGPRRIEAELRARGIAPAAAEKQVHQAVAGADLTTECLDLARRFARRYEPLEDPAERRKLASFLMRRGYEAQHVWAALRRLCAERSIAEEEEDDPANSEA